MSGAKHKFSRTTGKYSPVNSSMLSKQKYNIQLPAVKMIFINTTRSGAAKRTDLLNFNNTSSFKNYRPILMTSIIWGQTFKNDMVKTIF